MQVHQNGKKNEFKRYEEESLTRQNRNRRNEKQHILAIAAQIENKSFLEKLALKRKLTTYTTGIKVSNRNQEQREPDRTTDGIGNSSSISTKNYHFVIVRLINTNSWAYQQVQQPLNERKLKFAQEIEQHAQRLRHHYNLR